MSTPVPSQQLERELHAAGHTVVVGVDEVGRGAWAGPIVAAAVVMPLAPRIQGVRDSKKVSKNKREVLAEAIQERALYWHVAAVSAQEIDSIGIAEANREVMRRAVAGLGVQPHHVLLDAVVLDGLSVPQTSIIRGDATVYSIAAASLVAKVARDAMMDAFHVEYPHYAFDTAKGYGTAAHREGLEQHGVSAVHRRSFQPMRSMIY